MCQTEKEKKADKPTNETSVPSDSKKSAFQIFAEELSKDLDDDD